KHNENVRKMKKAAWQKPAGGQQRNGIETTMAAQGRIDMNSTARSTSSVNGTAHPAAAPRKLGAVAAALVAICVASLAQPAEAAGNRLPSARLSTAATRRSLAAARARRPVQGPVRHVVVGADSMAASAALQAGAPQGIIDDFSSATNTLYPMTVTSLTMNP